MKSYCLSLCFLTTAASIIWPGTTFWKNNQPSFTKVCLWSNDPSKFTPMCILCPNTLYPIVLNTCVMGSSIPLNVSYSQANCIVGNCAVNMNPKLPTKPKREAPEEAQSVAGAMFSGDEFDEDHSVPYTMIVDGQNVTITGIDAYFVRSDDRPDDDEDSLDDDME